MGLWNGLSLASHSFSIAFVSIVSNEHVVQVIVDPQQNTWKREFEFSKQISHNLVWIIEINTKNKTFIVYRNIYIIYHIFLTDDDCRIVIETFFKYITNKSKWSFLILFL